MASTPTSSNRLEQQGTGDNTNTWGIRLNLALTAVDAALDGVVAISTAGAKTLSTVDYVANEARNRILNYTNTTAAGTITIPALAKWYIVRAASKDVTLTNGGSSATVPTADQIAIVATDGASVWKMPGLSEAKAYADYAIAQQVFAPGTFPGAAGNSGKVLASNGAQAAYSTLNALPEYQADRAFLYVMQFAR
jgi:hypothetical protein